MRTVLILLSFTLTSLVAQVTSPKQTSIRQMIIDIQTAAPDQRFEKMNAFKRVLRKMNAADRQESIIKLQKMLHHKNGTNNIQSQKVQTHKQSQLQQRQQQLQLQQQIQKRKLLESDQLKRETIKKP